MKYLVILSVILLTGCELQRTSIEEYTARTKYCEDNGFTYESTQNKAGHVWVYCVKDGKQFKSKWEED